MKTFFKYLKQTHFRHSWLSLSNPYSYLHRIKPWLVGSTAIVATLSYPITTLAGTFPSITGLSFQTSGSSRAATIGDWYTTSTSSNTDRLHRFAVNVPQSALTNGSITVTINDAESATGTGSIVDEVTGTPDPTRFELRAADGTTVLQSQTVSSGSQHGTTINFTISQPGTYQVTSVTGAGPISGNNTTDLNDDDNGFSITAPNGVLIGSLQGTAQQDTGSALTALPFYFLVGPGTSNLYLRNFDLDNGGTVTYIRPSGTTVSVSTASGNGVWNGTGGTLNAGGDTVSLAANNADAGLWTYRINNWTNSNQTAFEANTGTTSILSNRIALFDTAPTTAGNFTITANTTLTTTIGVAVDHTFTVKNNFFTNDIINLTLTGTNTNYTVQLLDASGNALTDTDGDGAVDTGTLTPGQSKNFILRVTPKTGATTADTTRINAVSFMDKKVDAANNTTLFVDKTTTLAPDLTITKSHTGNFTQGQTGAIYTLTATNSGSASTSGTVTVTDTLPTGLTPTAATGTGWTCSISGQSVTCTRTDALAVGSSYPAITVTANVAANAASSVTNTANISGGGETNTTNNSASDLTTINAASTPPANTTACTVAYQEVYSAGSGNSSIYAVHVDSGATAVLTNTALVTTPNSLATDHTNRLVYYADGTSVYAWDVVNNTHITITTNISAFASGIKTLTGGGAAFYNGSLYLGVDNSTTTSNGNTPRVEIYKVDFATGSNGRTIQSVTATGLASTTVGVTADWGDFIISNAGVVYGSTSKAGGLWSFNLSTKAFSVINSGLGGYQLAKSSDGRLWAFSPSSATTPTIQELNPSTGALGTAKTTLASADGAECVRGISSIGDRIWNDRNANSILDSDETGIANVTVALYRDIDGNGTIGTGDPLLATQTTNASGNYNFTDLVLGKYIIKVTDTNQVLTGATLTSASDTKAVTLGSNQNITDADFGYQKVSKLVLVKRITAINSTAITMVVDDPKDANDTNANWPSSYLKGATSQSDIKPGDVVEYTIYFLSTGGSDASNASLCDLVPANTTFLPDTFASGKGIKSSLGTTTTDLTNASDADKGRFYASTETAPTACRVGQTVTYDNRTTTLNNAKGAVVVDLGTIAKATAPGTANSYGFVKFQVKVD